MGELYEPFPKLPKNIRQIGERDQVLKLYVEDYVNTYLKRLQPAKGADLRVGLLLGSRETHEDMPYVFVDGALEMENITQEGEKVIFNEDAWKKAYQDVERLFPKRTVQGWFLCGNPGCSLSPLNYWKQHSQYFTGKNQLMYLNSGLEGEETAYITSSDGFYKLRGYCVYYERNQMMQDYMVLRKDTPKAETGVNDRAIQDFRQRMEENKTMAGRHRNAVGALSGICTVLAVTVLAGGVAMWGNYQKMQQMESVVASVLPQEGESGKEWAFGGLKRAGEALADGREEEKTGFVIREAAGNISPTTAPALESSREQSSPVMPETMPQAGKSQAESGTGGALEETGESKSSQLAFQETDAGRESGGSRELTVGQEVPAGAEAAAPGQETVPASSAQSQAAAQPVLTAGYQVYEVVQGETLYGICFKLYQNLNHIDEICRVNALADVNNIVAGQKLLVP